MCAIGLGAVFACSAPFLQAQSSSPLLSEHLRVEKESSDGIIISWSFPATVSETFQRGLISIPSGDPGDPEVLDFGVHPPVDEPPPPRISLRILGVMRSCRVAVVNVPVHGYAAHTSARVRYVTGSLRIPWAGTGLLKQKRDDPIERILQTYLLNPQSRFNLDETTSQSLRGLPVPVYRQVPAVRLVVRREGPVTIGPYAWSKVAGERPDLNEIALFSEHRSVPFTVWSADGKPKHEGTLEKGDRLLFWSKQSSSPYSPVSIYWLCRRREDSLAVAPPVVRQVTSPGTKVLSIATLGEDNLFYPAGHKDVRQAAYWVWKEITPETPAAVPVPSLPALEPDVKVTFALLHERSVVRLASQALSFLLNGATVEAVIRQAPRPPFLTAEAQVPSASLARATSSLQIRVSPTRPTSVDTAPFYLDTIRLEYTREATYRGMPTRFHPEPGSYRIVSSASTDALVWVLDADGSIVSSQHLHPSGQVIVHASTNTEVVVFDPQKARYADLLSEMPPVSPTDHPLIPKRPVDLIIVAPERFHLNLLALAQHYRQRGIEPHLAGLEAIDALFGDGRLSPVNIKNYVHWVYERDSSHRPSYLLLVGDATWDYWGRFKNGIMNVLPAYRGSEPYPDENWFVCLTPGDTLPEMLVGRFPVRTGEELDVMIQRTIEYQTGKPTGWMNRVLLVTDNEFEKEMHEIFTRWLPSGYETSEVYLSDYPFRDNYYLPEDFRKAIKSKTSPKATDAVIEQLNKGVVLWEYFGHGAPNVLGHERIFFAGGSKFSDAKRLTNKSALPILWAFTCETGNFDYAREKWNISIGEDLLTRPTGGAINLLVATGRGFPRDHLILARGMHDAVFNRGLRGMAQAFAASCFLALAHTPRFEPQQQYCILGDPVFELPVPDSWPEEARMKVSLDQSDVLSYSIRSPGSDAVGRAWLRDSGHTCRWERTIGPGDWPVMGQISLQEAAGPFWNEEERFSFGVSAILPSGMVHDGTSILPPKLAAPPQVGSGSPNLTILADAISSRPPYLENGVTIFFDVPVLNSGNVPTPRSYLRPFIRDPKGQPDVLENFVGPNQIVVPALLPNASRVVTARWDPIDNSGTHTIFFECDPFNRIEEIDEEDNTAQLVIRVHKKADLRVRPEDITVRHDPERKQFIVNFSVYNVGETDAPQVVIELTVGYDDGRPDQSITLDVWRIRAGERRIAYNVGIEDKATWLRIAADPDEVIDEETHKNNSARVPLIVPQ